MPARLQRCSLKLAFAFFAALALLVAQDPTSYLSSDVMRVGDKLACRCGGCRNTVGNCPMLRCSSADPLRQRIYQEQKAGLTDKAIVDGIVREEGIVALASPPAEGIGPVITWVMPGIALVVGFFIYSWYVRRNRKEPAPLSVQDRAMMDRFRAQIERDFDEQPDPGMDHLSDRR